MIDRRLKIIAGLAVALSAASAMIAQSPPSDGLACIADMPIPEYRGVIWTARVTGEATATFMIGVRGSPVSVTVQSGQPALVAWLKSALSAAVFLDRCAGQSVGVKFIYRLEGGPEGAPRNEIRLKGPTTFEIVAHPPIPHIEP
jgi:hypothetical protein